MTPCRCRTRAWALALGVLTAAPLASAPAEQTGALARRLHEAGEILPLERIRELALGVKAGTLIDSELESEQGRWVYDLEVLDAEGRVWDIELDARDGALLGVELDD